MKSSALRQAAFRQRQREQGRKQFTLHMTPAEKKKVDALLKKLRKIED